MQLRAHGLTMAALSTERWQQGYGHWSTRAMPMQPAGRRRQMQDIRNKSHLGIGTPSGHDSAAIRVPAGYGGAAITSLVMVTATHQTIMTALPSEGRLANHAHASHTCHGPVAPEACQIGRD